MWVTEVKTLRYGAYPPDMKELSLTAVLAQVARQEFVAKLCDKPYQVVVTSEWLATDLNENTMGLIPVRAASRGDYDYFDLSASEDEAFFYGDAPELMQ